MMEEIRQNLGRLPGVNVEVGQPISHRIDHLLSGTRAQIAIKLFGPDLATLRSKAEEIRAAMETVPGIVDLLVEPQVGVPQVQVNMNRQAAAAVGLRADDLAETVETAFSGHEVSQVLEEQKTYDVLVRFNDSARQSVNTIARTLIDTPTGAKVPIGQVAEVRVDQGPNTINRENVQRRIIVQANVADRDLGSVIEGVRTSIGRKVQLPQGYYVQYGGQFEAQEKASRQITLLSMVAICRHLPSTLFVAEIGALCIARNGKPAARAYRRNSDGAPVGRHTFGRFACRVHNSVRDRHAQRNHAHQPLHALDERRGSWFS